MISLKALIASLIKETSPTAWKKNQKDSEQFGSGLDGGPTNVGAGSLSPAQIAAREKAGVPKDAISQPGGNWYDKSGKYLGRTRAGKFVKADEKEQEKAQQRGGHEGDSDYRSQQSRTDRAKVDAETERLRSTRQRQVKAASSAVQTRQTKMGLNPQTGGMSREMIGLVDKLSADKNSKFENPNEKLGTQQDKEILAVGLDDYIQATGGKTNEREIAAVGKANSAMPEISPHRGTPLGVHTGEDGKKYVMMRAKNIDMYALKDERGSKQQSK
jgi:hypothetical protein